MGLFVEALSLLRVHPLAFLGFMFIGGAFLVAGIAVYLLSLVSTLFASPGCYRVFLLFRFRRFRYTTTTL